MVFSTLWTKFNSFWLLTNSSLNPESSEYRKFIQPQQIIDIFQSIFNAFFFSKFHFFFSKKCGNFHKLAQSVPGTISFLFQIFRWKLVFERISDDFRRVLIKKIVRTNSVRILFNWINTFSLNKKKFPLKTFWNHPKCKRSQFLSDNSIEKFVRMTF